MTNLQPRWLTDVPEDAVKRGSGKLAIEFAEAFGVITKDSVAGQMGSPIHLRDWQKEIFRKVLAKDEQGNFRQRLNIVSTPRKNGKSAMGSMFALFHLYLGVKGGEIYSVAADKDQARIIFSDTKKMLQSNPELTEMQRFTETQSKSPQLVLSIELGQVK